MIVVTIEAPIVDPWTQHSHRWVLLALVWSPTLDDGHPA